MPMARIQNRNPNRVTEPKETKEPVRFPVTAATQLKRTFIDKLAAMPMKNVMMRKLLTVATPDHSGLSTGHYSFLIPKSALLRTISTMKRKSIGFAIRFWQSLIR